MPAYEEKYPVGSSVRIVGRAQLESFRHEWQTHHPLEPDQLAFAGHDAVVREVSFYHGGDALYLLDGAPGTWHEACLTQSTGQLTFDDIVDALDRYHQRATYGAVGGVLDQAPAFLMNGLPRSPRYSWVVNAETLLPTGYTDEQMHPALRERDLVITSFADLDEWVRNPS